MATNGAANASLALADPGADARGAQVGVVHRSWCYVAATRPVPCF
jgi:hypothetical protein